MANICDNNFKIFCEEENIIEEIVKKLDELFNDELDGNINYIDENLIEGYFESRWDFPYDIFKHFFDEFDDDSIEMMCLSVEWGCNVFAMNIYRNKKWEESQYFNV